MYFDMLKLPLVKDCDKIMISKVPVPRLLEKVLKDFDF